MPSILSEKDANLLLQRILATSTKKRSSNVNGIILAETVVTCQAFLDRLIEPFKANVTEKATKVVNNGEYGKAIKEHATNNDSKFDYSLSEQVDKKEERRKKAAGGSKGGGTQGREGKTKSTKKKGGGNKRGGRRDSFDSDDEEFSTHAKKGNTKSEKSSNSALMFMTVSEVEAALKNISVLQDACDELFEAIAIQIQPTLSKLYNETVSDIYRSSLTASLQKKKKSHVEFQEKTTALVDSIRLFEKGLSSFEDGSDKSALEKYLIKSLCTELVNGVFYQLVSDHDIHVDQSKELNHDQRVKLLGQLPKDISDHLVIINKALNSNKVEDFVHTLEDHLADACDVLIRKIDKKKDRQTQFHHRQSLMDQIQTCQEPATIMLLVCLVIFQLQTGNMLHASGKFVPIIVKQISPQLDNTEKELLQNYQDLIMKQFSASTDEKSQIQQQLENLSKDVKEIALKPSKQ